MSYGDGYFEQAYSLAASDLAELERNRVSICGVSSERACEAVVAAVREHVDADAFLRAYKRCVDLGYPGQQMG